MPLHSKSFAFSLLASGALVAGAGCSHPAYGPDGETRLEQAVKDSANHNDNPTNYTADDIAKQSCADYRTKLNKAHAEDAKEEDRLDAYMDLYKEIKGKNDYLEKALATNPDLQFQAETQAVTKTKEDCVAALAEVRSDYYAFLAEISEVLVVQDIHGNAAPRLDFNKYRTAVTVLDPEDRDSFFSRIDAAAKKVKAAKESASSPQ
jgi:hypothetical protein